MRPNVLGTRSEFCHLFERPIQNGQCLDSCPADVDLMKERVYVLHSLLKEFVNWRSQALLTSSLTPIEESVLMLRLTPLQRSLYRHCMSECSKKTSVALEAHAICLQILNHPDILYHAINRRDDMDDREPSRNDSLESAKELFNGMSKLFFRSIITCEI